jgi:hypothetical protein
MAIPVTLGSSLLKGEIMLRYISIATVLLCGFAVEASQTVFDIKEVRVREVQENVSEPLLANDCTKLNSIEPMLEIGWADIVNVGQKIWEIIKENKPVLNIETPVAHALPRGLTCWNELEGWRAPITKSYEVSYVNGFDMEAVKLRVRLHYTYGGGKAQMGKYLTNVTVLPSEINVAWGYTFNAKVEVADAINMGTVDNPLAGLELNLRWNVQTIFMESENSVHFFVQGDGEYSSAEQVIPLD